MRYAPPGLVLNDFAVLSADDGWHLLHLQGSPVMPFDAGIQETSYGHAYSTDLLRWEAQGPVFGIARPGRFDDSAIWTMCAVDHPDGGLALLYTGVTNSPCPATQAIGLARSPRRDGTAWRRVRETPVCTAEPRWYRTDAHQAWRDPFVVRDDEREEWIMFVAAREAGLAPAVGGCVAAAVSTDLEAWTALPPAIRGGEDSELECPVVEWVDGRWLMLVCVSTDHSVRTFEADNLRGPWFRLGRLGPPGVYAPRVVRTRDEWVVLHTVQRRHGLDDRGELVRGMLAQPKRLATGADGVPVLLWWPPVGDQAAPPTSLPVHDAIIEVDVPDQASEIAVTVNAGARRLVEVRVSEGRIWIGYADGRILQEVSLAKIGLPVAAPGDGPGDSPHCPRHLRLLVVGEFCEVYADDVLVLATIAYERSRGWPLAEADGKVLPVVVRPLLSCYPDRDDVSAI